MKNPRLNLIAASLALALSSTASQAVLERVGPINAAPGVGSFPAWYQDTTGLALEFCDPKNAAEVAGGHCLLLPADVTNVPETFPTNFFDEHFYFAAGAAVTTPGGSKGTLVLAEEAAFAGGAAAPGDQITFSRIRVRLTAVPVSGTYRFIHPYGEESLEGVAGGVIFFTDDVGVGCAPGQFDCSMGSRLGPFLLPSATPGGLEQPPVAGPVAGKLYIADPGREGPVTGSTLPNFIDSTGTSRNHNIFRIEGPAGSNLGGPGIDFIETTNFSLVGRIFSGAMPGRVTVDRASYARNASGSKVDIFATGLPTTSGRVPGQPAPAAIAPKLSLFSAPCAGTLDANGVVQPPYSAPLGAVETPLLTQGERYWAQIQPAAVPAGVCLQDLSATDPAGLPIPVFYQHGLADEVTVSRATYDSATQTLTVAATSSDETVPPTLSATFAGFRGDLVNGQIVIPLVSAPPANVRVQSSAQGIGQLPVNTGFAAPPLPPVIPVAADDAFVMNEDSGPQSLAILSNDTNALGGVVTLTSPPVLGTATLNADGTVTYTPQANINGTDSFTYTVNLAGQVSNIGNVTLNITPVNDPPVARNDSASTLVNTPVSINVLANDTDVEGAADIVAAVNLTQPAAGATASVAGGVVTFNATAAGTYSFTYQAQDVALATSAPATVTVTVTAPPPVVVPDTVSIGRAEYVRSKNNLQVQGTVSPAVSEAITLSFVNAAGAELGAAGSTLSDAKGQWQLNQIVALPVGATAVKAVSAKGGTRTLTLSIK